MANFVLSLHSGVTNTDCVNHLFRFANQLLEENHTISCIFLYQDAVYHVLENITIPSDELPIMMHWRELAEQGVSLQLCVTAAEKRGIDINNTGLFQVSGLAEFAMLAAQADKWVQFK